MTDGCFITYWACGICCGGAYVDTPDALPGAGRMLLEAVREGRKVGYVKATDVPQPKLIWQCPHANPEGGK